MNASNRERNGMDELGMARGALESARRELDAGGFLTVANRAYYACFHAARAALMAVDVQGKSHKGLWKMFSLHFIKPGHLDARLSRTAGDLSRMRGIADYGKARESMEAITPEVAARLVEDAAAFVEAVEAWVRGEWERFGEE